MIPTFLFFLLHSAQKEKQKCYVTSLEGVLPLRKAESERRLEPVRRGTLNGIFTRL